MTLPTKRGFVSQHSMRQIDREIAAWMRRTPAETEEISERLRRKQNHTKPVTQKRASGISRGTMSG